MPLFNDVNLFTLELFTFLYIFWYIYFMDWLSFKVFKIHFNFSHFSVYFLLIPLCNELWKSLQLTKYFFTLHEREFVANWERKKVSQHWFKLCMMFFYAKKNSLFRIFTTCSLYTRIKISIIVKDDFNNILNL